MHSLVVTYGTACTILIIMLITATAVRRADRTRATRVTSARVISRKAAPPSLLASHTVKEKVEIPVEKEKAENLAAKEKDLVGKEKDRVMNQMNTTTVKDLLAPMPRVAVRQLNPEASH